MPSVKFRRVVTGHDERGAAVVSLDGQPPNIRDFKSQSGLYFTEVWSTVETPAEIDDGSDPTLTTTGIQPPPGGSVIRTVDIPPEEIGHETDLDLAKAHFAEIGSVTAATASNRSKHPLMHRTETVDYGIVLEGSITLVLDDSEVELTQGDIVIQRGTNHAWANRSGKLCRMVFVLLDGRHSSDLKRRVDQGASKQ